MLKLRYTWIFVMLGLAACGPRSSELELEGARSALDDAKNSRAQKCAPEIYQAAEEALREAQALKDLEDFDGSRKKAQTAEALAKQARDASPPGCDKTPEAEPVKAEEVSSIRETSMPVALDSVEQTIYFDYNQANIREDSKQILTQIAAKLGQAPEMMIEIEGHCDIRGSTEYNLHLGERRAYSVQKYLLTQGVRPGQINVISYGEERPVDLGDSESAHQRNRRAEIKKR